MNYQLACSFITHKFTWSYSDRIRLPQICAGLDGILVKCDNVIFNIVKQIPGCSYDSTRHLRENASLNDNNNQ